MIALKGTAEAVGKSFGEIAKKSVLELASLFKPPENWEKRIERFKDILGEVAPHWLEEGEAICQSAGIDFSLLLAYNLPSHTDGCTSFIALNTESGFPILHKNRDFAIERQSFFIKKIEGYQKFIAGASCLDLGVAYFLNEAGLAGACNTGGHCDDEPTDGLLDRHLLRLMAERARDRKEALGIAQDLLNAGFLSTEGENRGFIILLLDKEGGMVIEYTAKELKWEEAKDGLLIRSNSFLLLENKKDDISSQQRLQRAWELLGGKGKVKPEDIWAVAGDREGSYPICGKHTVGALTVVLHPLLPSLSLAFAFPGPPDKAFPFPLSIASDETPEELIGGDYWINPNEI